MHYIIFVWAVTAYATFVKFTVKSIHANSGGKSLVSFYSSDKSLHKKSYQEVSGTVPRWIIHQQVNNLPSIFYDEKNTSLTIKQF